jgi:hypothetical protein
MGGIVYRKTEVQASPGQKHETLPIRKIKRMLEMWLKWYSACLAMVKPTVQTTVVLQPNLLRNRS